MADPRVEGTLTVTGGGVAGGFTVEIHERGLAGKKRLATSQKTDALGKYSVSYPASLFSRTLVIELYDEVHRLIDSATVPGVNAPVLVHDTTTSTANAHGWLVITDGLPSWLSTGNQVTLLTDNAAAWGELTRDVVAASQVVHMSQLQFELGYMFTEFIPDPPSMGVPTTGRRLEDEFLKAATARGMEVKLLMNDFLIGYPADMEGRVRRFFKGTPVEVRGFKRRLLQGAMHAKLAIIDRNSAYTIGSGLIQEYFDGRHHLIDDPRRGNMLGPGNAMRVPIHDLSAKIVGAAAQHIEAMFQRLWNPTVSPAVAPTPAAPGAHAVQIVVTVPGATLAGLPEGATGILQAYQRAIRYAEDFIYIENQYLTDIAIVDAIEAVMKLRPALQVVMLLNPKVDLPLYGRAWYFPFIKWQDAAIARIVKVDPARVGVYSLWGHEMPATGSRIIRNYVHSKVAVVDDKWATVGSANLDGFSLSSSPYIPLLVAGREQMRAIEANAVFFNGVAGQPASDLPDSIRRTMWAEHLGYANAAHPDLTARPAGGWLALWEKVAARRLAALTATPARVDDARILRGPFYVPDTGKRWGLWAEEGYLLRCGVDPTKHKVETEVRSFNFGTGKWH